VLRLRECPVHALVKAIEPFEQLAPQIFVTAFEGV
jgi:hypothetical protein